MSDGASASQKVEFTRSILEEIEKIPGVQSAKVDDWTDSGSDQSAFVELKWHGELDMFKVRDRESRRYLDGDQKSKRRSQMPRIVRAIQRAFAKISATHPSMSAYPDIACPKREYKTVDGVKKFQFYSDSFIRLAIKVLG